MSMLACETCATLLDTDDVETVVWNDQDAPLCVDCAEGE